MFVSCLRSRPGVQTSLLTPHLLKNIASSQRCQNHNWSPYRKSREEKLTEYTRNEEGQTIRERYPRLHHEPSSEFAAPAATVTQLASKSLDGGKQAQTFGEVEPDVGAISQTPVPGPQRISVPQFRDRFGYLEKGERPLDEVDTVTLSGRVTYKRLHGKYLVFLNIVNEYESIQVLLNWKALHDKIAVTKPNFRLFTRMLERGDHISVTGVATRTPTGELTIEAADLPELLAPALQPIPESITDANTKAENRHLDMMVNADVTDTLRLRSHIIRYMRDFLHNLRFQEVQTPIIAANAGGAIARPFTTYGVEFQSKELALRIAPELWLKRLVVGGIQRVFEIGPVFRNEGIDATHNPEFTTCEFYGAYMNLRDLMRVTEFMFHNLARHCQTLIDHNLRSLPAIPQTLFKAPFQRVEFVPALQAALGFPLPNLHQENSLPDLLTALQLAKITVPGDPPATLSRLLDRLAAMYLEPLSFEKPTFIMNHPACMSPLSKSYMCPVTKQWVSARAELFVQGREVANMYEEENDPAVQREKMAAYSRAVVAARNESAPSFTSPSEVPLESDEELPQDQVEQQQQQIGSDSSLVSFSPPSSDLQEAEIETPPIDNQYIEVLEAGLPPTGGWGCGIDRLVMLLSGSKRLADCLPFGSLRNVVNLASTQPIGPSSSSPSSSSSSTVPSEPVA